MALNTKRLLRRRKGLKAKGTTLALKMPVANAEFSILRQIKETPMSPVELVQAVRSEDERVDELAVRQAMWTLVSKGRIEFSRDWRLQLAQ